MEQFVLNTIVEKARAAGVRRVIGEYLPTAKNGMVKDHFSKLGFTVDKENHWALECAGYAERPVKITLVKAEEPAGV